MYCRSKSNKKFVCVEHIIRKFNTIGPEPVMKDGIISTSQMKHSMYIMAILTD